MTRDELEHIIRASGEVTNQYEFVIVGSQSILGQVPHPHAVFTMSAEADIYPLQAPELADRIEGALGEGSRFHETHGYYAQGVGPETAVLPTGGCNVCTASSRPPPMAGSVTASMPSTCSCRRRLQAGTRTASSAWPCSDTGTSTQTRPWRWSPRCPLEDVDRRRLGATIRRWNKALGETP